MAVEIIKKIFAGMKGANVTNISFVRGYGIIEDYFCLIFENSTIKYKFEIETNFRIRDKNRILLAFNDLYIDSRGKEISVRKYRSQKNIEKTLLFQNLNIVNQKINNTCIKDIKMFFYGDINIILNNGIVIEILNDTHKENSILLRLEKSSITELLKYEIVFENQNLMLH